PAARRASPRARSGDRLGAGSDSQDEVSDEGFAELIAEAVRLAVEAVAREGRDEELDVRPGRADAVGHLDRALDVDELVRLAGEDHRRGKTGAGQPERLSGRVALRELVGRAADVREREDLPVQVVDRRVVPDAL